MLAGKLMTRQRGGFEGKIMVGGRIGQLFFSTNGSTYTDISNVPGNPTGDEFDTPVGSATLNMRGDADGSGVILIPCSNNLIYKTTDGGDTWEDYAAPSNRTDITFLKYVNGFWWLGTDLGDLYKSLDGKNNWTQEINDFGAYLSDIIHNGTFYIVTGGDGVDLKSYKSTDGDTFTEHTGSGILSATEEVLASAWGASIFVVVGSGGLIATSSDGQSWTERSVTGDPDFTDLKFDGTTFMAVTANGEVWISTNGTGWTQETSPTNVSELASIEHYNGTWVVAGDNTSNVNVVWTSTDDGTTWTSRSLDSPFNEATEAQYGDLIFDSDSNKFILVGPAEKLVSTLGLHIQSGNSTGTTWTKKDIDGTGIGNVSKDIHAITTDESRWVCVGERGYIISSDNDGDTWTDRSVSEFDSFHAVLYNSSMSPAWVAVGQDGLIYSSTDGATWVDRIISPAITDDLYSLACDGTTWVACGQNGKIYSSTNGTSWTLRTPGSASTKHFWGITYGGSQFVIAASDGEAQTSPSGTTWTLRTVTAQAGNLQQIIWAEELGKYFAYQSSGQDVWDSTDGITWNETTGIGFSAGVNNPREGSVAYAEHSDASKTLFIAVAADTTGDDFHIFSSVDGITYTGRSADGLNNTTPGTVLEAVAMYSTV